MKDIVIFPSNKKMVLIAIGSFIFIAVGAFIIISSSASLHGRLVGGYLGVFFFGFCLVYAVFRLVNPLPSLVISDGGLFDNASAVGAGMLHWSEISEVKIYSFISQRYLGIVPKDLKSVLKRQGILKRWTMRLNQGLVGAPFNIPEFMLPVKLEEILEAIDARRIRT